MGKDRKLPVKSTSKRTEQYVYSAQRVNMKIFKFVRLVKKLPICFPLFLSMIKSTIYTNDLFQFQPCSLDEIQRIWSVKLPTLRLLFYKMEKDPSSSCKLFKLTAFWDLIAIQELRLFPFIIVETNYCDTNCMKKRTAALSFHLSMNRNSQVAK